MATEMCFTESGIELENRKVYEMKLDCKYKYIWNVPAKAALATTERTFGVSHGCFAILSEVFSLS